MFKKYSFIYHLKHRYDNIEDDCMIEANKMNIQFQFLIGLVIQNPNIGCY